MPRQIIGLLLFVYSVIGVCTKSCLAQSPPPIDTTSVSMSQVTFPVQPHDDVTIEWWYLNANVHTATGRHLALIGSFFRFGNAKGLAAANSKSVAKLSHYLIYAVTDIDQDKHYAYSLGDKKTLQLLQQVAALELERNPSTPEAAQLTSLLGSDCFPPPTKTISKECQVTGSPFDAEYGPGNYLRAVPGKTNTYDLALSAGPATIAIKMRFSAEKPPMYVNGDGNTGLRVRTDMKYVSLTRCNASGSINTGAGLDQVTGEGWFDHQWGSSWTTQSAGWDWWGVQLANKRDILFFRQLNLKTGKPFFPCATFEDAAGNQVTTHNIIFQIDPHSIWKSSRTGVAYPLGWLVTFPRPKTLFDNFT